LSFSGVVIGLVRTDLNHVAHATKHECHSGDNFSDVIRSLVIMYIPRLLRDGLEMYDTLVFIVSSVCNVAVAMCSDCDPTSGAWSSPHRTLMWTSLVLGPTIK